MFFIIGTGRAFVWCELLVVPCATLTSLRTGKKSGTQNLCIILFLVLFSSVSLALKVGETGKATTRDRQTDRMSE